jgi:multiple sugar transport system permease protein
MDVKHRQIFRNTAFYVTLVIAMIPALFIFFWMLLSSFKTPLQNTAYPPIWIFTPTFENYIEAWKQNPFPRYTLNSMVVAVGTTVLGLLAGLPAAYAIARWKLQKLAVGILLARVIPGISLLVPWYLFFRKIGLIDTHISLIMSHLIVGMPLIIWVMISFFEDIPKDLEDAAMIDGCSIFGSFLRVCLPLVKPGIIATGILSFIFSWNNFMFSLILAGYKTRTLPVAVYNFMSYDAINWGGLSAAATLIILPVLLLVFWVQRHIVHGLTFGGLKG